MRCRSRGAKTRGQLHGSLSGGRGGGEDHRRGRAAAGGDRCGDALHGPGETAAPAAEAGGAGQQRVQAAGVRLRGQLPRQREGAHHLLRRAEQLARPFLDLLYSSLVESSRQRPILEIPRPILLLVILRTHRSTKTCFKTV